MMNERETGEGGMKGRRERETGQLSYSLVRGEEWCLCCVCVCSPHEFDAMIHCL